MQMPDYSTKFVEFIAHELAVKPFRGGRKTSQTDQSHKTFPDGYLRNYLNKMRFKIEKQIFLDSICISICNHKTSQAFKANFSFNKYQYSFKGKQGLFC